MKNIEFLKENDLSNTQIRKIFTDSWTEDGIDYMSIKIDGAYVKDDYRFYTLWFCRIQVCEPELKEKIGKPDNTEHLTLKAVSVSKTDDGYDSKIELSNNGSDISVSFVCGHFTASGSHYLGFDYTNVYDTPEYLKMYEENSYVFDEQYFREEKNTELTDGFSLYERTYIHQDEHAVYARGAKSELRKYGKCIYAYAPCDNHHVPYKEIIHHSNGHRYYPFHVNLYGISYIDVDTLEVFNYVPRGYDNSYGMPNGESFIVTTVFYDPASDLVAYEGCYWAGPYNVMIGNLADPMNFDPHLISINLIFDPENEGCCDTDFISWDKDGITVKIIGDGTRTEKISFEDLKKAAETQKKTCEF